MDDSSILLPFLAARDGGTKPNESTDDSSKQEFEIIKELVKAASKKTVESKKLVSKHKATFSHVA